MKRTPDAAGLEFLSWLKRYSPAMYSHVMSRIGSPPGAGIFALNELNGIGPGAFPGAFPGSGLLDFGQVDPWGGVGVSASPPASSTGGFMDYINQAFETAQQAIPAYFQYKTQSDIMEMNIARAKQGLPPVDPGVVAPQVKVIHDVPPAVQGEIQKWTSGMGNIALWGALGLGAFFLIRMVAR